jgi:hypothetical protein
VRRGPLAAAGGVLLLGAAGAAYVTLLPGHAASSYRDRVQPSLGRIEPAMEEVYDSFEPGVFAAESRQEGRSARERSPRRYVVDVRRSVSGQRRKLRAPRAAIARARSALERDGDDLVALSTPPLLGSAGGLVDARAVRDDARAYRRESMALLEDYDGLLDYQARSLDVSLAFARAYGGGLARVARMRSDRAATARALGATAAAVSRAIRDYDRLRAPGPLAPAQRAGRDAGRLVAAKLRQAAAAVRRRDPARLAAVQRGLRVGARRLVAGSAGALRALIEGSSVRLRIDRTRRLSRQLQRGLKGL